MAKRFQSIVKENISLILSLAFLFAWVFEIRFTSLLYLDSDQILHSAYFSLSAVGVVLLCLLLIRPSIFRLSWRSLMVALGIVMMVCAVLLTLIPYITYNFVDIPYSVLYVFNGVLFGVVIFGMTLWAVSIAKRCELITSLVLLISSSIIGLILLVVSNWLVSWEYGYLHALLPCLSFFIIMFNLKHIEKLGVDDNPPKSLVTKSKFILPILLFLSGFFVVYMPTMFPKTTNLTIAYYPDFCFGGLNYVSLVALILYIAFLVFILLVVGGIAIGTPIATLLVTVVFAFAFYFLSSMSTSNLPFLFFMPCSTIFAMCSCVIFLATVDLDHEEGMRRLRTGLIWLFSGGLLAAVFSTLFLRTITNSVEIIDTYIELLTGSVFITIGALFIALRSDIAKLLLPSMIFKEKLDSSSLENRCKLIGSHYKLTDREIEVLMLLAEGRNEPYIEEALTVSRATIKTHIKHIYQKINVSSRQELLDLLHSE